MSESNGDRRATRRSSSPLLIALVVVLAAPLAVPAARAGAIHHPKVHLAFRAEPTRVSIESATVSAESVMEKWDPYFANALEHHLLRVHGPNAVKLLSVMVDGQGGLPDNSFVRYLMWRHGLSAERFDANHPGLGTFLENSQILKAAAVPPTTPLIAPPILGQGALPPIEPPPITTSSPITPPIEGQSPQVPEPASFLMAAMMAGAAAVARKWGSRRA